MELPIIKNEIKTPRLTIKPYSAEDAEALVSLLTDEELTKTFMVPVFESHEQALKLAEKLILFSSPQDTRHLECGIYADGRLVGFVNDCGAENDTIELGYAIAASEKGKGYATEAVKAVIGELREMGFHTVRAGYFEENSASRRVMEKCGMTPVPYTETVTYRGELHNRLYCEIKL